MVKFDIVPFVKDKSTMLTRRGYAIPKLGLSPEHEKKILKELNVAPVIPGRRFANPQTFRIYAESLTQYFLPRVWATEVFGVPKTSNLSDGDPLREDLVFTGTPYDYQT